MRGAMRSSSHGRSGLLLAICLGLAACQSSSVDDALDVKSEKVESVSAGLETIGSGPLVIGMLTGLAGSATAAERDYRDGARLAARQLGADQVTLAIYNARPNADATSQGFAALKEKGAKLVIGPARADLLAPLSAMPASARPPVLAFVSNGAAHGGGVFAFLTDEVDNAVEAAAYASGAGRKKLFLVHDPSMGGAALKRLRDGIEAEGVKIIAAVSSSGTGGSLAASGATLQNADVVMLAPGMKEPAQALAALRATGAMAPNALVLGSAEMTAQRALSGMLVCRVDQLSVGDVLERYRTEFGRRMSRDAAYGFDAAALAIGIARARGAEGLTARTLGARSGFRGLLGAFRFTGSGAVERNCSIYRVADAKFELQDPAPEGF